MIRKKLFAITILATFMIGLFGQSILVSSAKMFEDATPVDTKSVLTFLRDVVGVAVDKYEVQLSICSAMVWSDNLVKTTGQYTLDSTGLGGTSLLTISFTYWNETLVSCSAYEAAEGPTIYIEKPSGGSTDIANAFLKNYESYIKDSEISKYKSILDAVKSDVNVTETRDNIKLDVSINSNTVLFTWSNSINGAAYSRLILEIKDGEFSEFGDDRSFYVLGSEAVNITKERAIQIALDCISGYTYKYNDSEVSQFNIVEDQILTNMQVLGKSSSLQVYPCWTVDLSLEKVYPGAVYYFEVRLWADTGEIIDCTPLGYGDESEIHPEELGATPSSSVNDGASSFVSSFAIAASCVIIIVALLTAAISLKKRKIFKSSPE